MSRSRFRSSLSPALALAGLVLAACFQDPDGPHAGTATTTGNTISGRVLPDAGGPVPASVILYSEGYRPGPGGDAFPGAIRIETLADSEGRFSLEAPSGRGYVLAASTGGETPRVHWEGGIRADTGVDTLRLGTLILRPAATLRGRILLPEGTSIPSDPESSRVWVGFPGTGAFARTDRQGAFLLEELPAGERILEVLWDRRRGREWSRETFPVEGIDLLEGRNHVLDSVDLGRPRPAPDTLRAGVCLADPAILRPLPAGSGRSAAGTGRDRLRAFTTVAPHDLFELDLCRGSWRRVTRFPVSPRLLFSDSARDYAVLGGRREVVRIDPVTGAQEALPFAPVPHSVGYHGGRYYTFTETDSLLRMYPDEAAFLADRPSGTFRWPFPITLGSYDLSAVAGGLHYVTEGARLELYFLDLEDPAAPEPSSAKVLAGFSGGYRGFAGGQDGTVWVMNGANELFQYPVSGGAWIRKLAVEGAPELRGLTQFP